MYQHRFNGSFLGRHDVPKIKGHYWDILGTL